LTLLERQLCCQEYRCIFGEDQSGREVCDCTRRDVMAKLASAQVAACAILEGLD
jgi:hypothetical protein